MAKFVKNDLPQVSVIMSVYNGQKFLREAIESILGQSFKDFEFIIINDGSTDDTKAIIQSYKDKRIKLFNQKNHGLVFSLNKAIGLAKAELIARQDDDDISEPDRLKQEVQFMNDNPDHVLVGGAFEVIDENGKFIMFESNLTDDIDIRRMMVIRNPFAHGSTMFRAKAIRKAGGYHNDCGPTEDFELWSRLAKEGKVANLPQLLYKWRVNLSGISQKNSQVQATFTKQITKANFKAARIKKLECKNIKQRAKFYLAQDKKMGPFLKTEFLKSYWQFTNKLLKTGHFASYLKNLLYYFAGGKSSFAVAYFYTWATIKDTVRDKL